MFSDGAVDLMEAGVITNRRKNFHPGKSVVTFVMGTKRLYDFVDNNPADRDGERGFCEQSRHHREE